MKNRGTIGVALTAIVMFVVLMVVYLDFMGTLFALTNLFQNDLGGIAVGFVCAFSIALLTELGFLYIAGIPRRQSAPIVALSFAAAIALSVSPSILANPLPPLVVCLLAVAFIYAARHNRPISLGNRDGGGASDPGED